MLSPLNEREKQINADYNWCLTDAAVRRQYGGLVVVAHRRQIWGAGKTHGDAAREAWAKPGCPSKDQVAFVYVPEAD